MIGSDIIHLDNDNFEVLWLKISLPMKTIFYCFPNSTDYNELLKYLTYCREKTIESHHKT